MIWESELDDELALFVHVMFLLHMHLDWKLWKEKGCGG